MFLVNNENLKSFKYMIRKLICFLSMTLSSVLLNAQDGVCNQPEISSVAHKVISCPSHEGKTGILVITFHEVDNGGQFKYTSEFIENEVVEGVLVYDAVTGNLVINLLRFIED